jgi:hypothetical protein
MIKNLKQAGIAGGGGGGDQKGDDGKHGHEDWRERLQSLEGTHTLTGQRFDVTLVRPEGRERAMRCEALDELEEFTLLIRHCFCLQLGVATLLSHVQQRWRILWDCLPRWDSKKYDARR